MQSSAAARAQERGGRATTAAPSSGWCSTLAAASSEAAKQARRTCVRVGNCERAPGTNNNKKNKPAMRRPSPLGATDDRRPREAAFEWLLCPSSRRPPQGLESVATHSLGMPAHPRDSEDDQDEEEQLPAAKRASPAARCFGRPADDDAAYPHKKGALWTQAPSKTEHTTRHDRTVMAAAR